LCFLLEAPLITRVSRRIFGTAGRRLQRNCPVFSLCLARLVFPLSATPHPASSLLLLPCFFFLQPAAMLVVLLVLALLLRRLRLCEMKAFLLSCRRLARNDETKPRRPAVVGPL